MRRLAKSDIPWSPTPVQTKEQRQRAFQQMLDKYATMANKIFGPPESDGKPRERISLVPQPVPVRARD